MARQRNEVEDVFENRKIKVAGTQVAFGAKMGGKINLAVEAYESGGV
jgi:hypothetical protein